MRTLKNNVNVSSVYEEARRYLVVTDGILTEATYFERVKELTRDTILIKKVKHTDDLVLRAIEMRGNGNFDEVFIVCDIDDHCNGEKNRLAFEAFLKEAAENGVKVLCSHECFEVWLLAHKRRVPSEAKDREVAKGLARKEGLLKGNNSKVVVGRTITVESIKAASAEAKRMRSTYGGDALEDGPMTDVDTLIDLLTF